MLPPLALQRAEVASGVRFEPENVVIIGDTPADISCAQSIGARTIAVATGPFTSAELRAHGPTHVFESMADPTRSGRHPADGQRVPEPAQPPDPTPPGRAFRRTAALAPRSPLSCCVRGGGRRAGMVGPAARRSFCCRRDCITPLPTPSPGSLASVAPPPLPEEPLALAILPVNAGHRHAAADAHPSPRPRPPRPCRRPRRPRPACPPPRSHVIEAIGLTRRLCRSASICPDRRAYRRGCARHLRRRLAPGFRDPRRARQHGDQRPPQRQRRGLPRPRVPARRHRPADAAGRATGTRWQTMVLVREPLDVRQANARWILPTTDERVTLITCWPYESNSHRLVVIALPVPLPGGAPG